jgi:hypothetical protein
MRNIKIHITSFFIFGIITLLFPLQHINAATIGFSPSSGTYRVGDTINLKVYIGAESKSVNAVSAYIKFSKDILSLSSISKVGSIINLWAQEPSFSNGDGLASFEGVILNGYTGNSGDAVTLVFKAKSSGEAKITFNNASVLANDGNGTDVLYTKGLSVLKILEKTETTKPIGGDVVPVAAPVLDTTIVISEIKNNVSQYSPNKFLITSPQSVSDKSYVIQIDSLPSVIWTDDGTHIYQSPELKNGMHVIKVMAIDVNSNQLSGFLNFYTTFLKVPVITYYPNNLFVGDFIVLKGIADPSVDVELTISSVATGGVILEHAFTNGDGKFTFVPENKIPAGKYSVIARSIATNGVSSAYMSPIQIIVREHELNFFVTIINNYMIIIIPFIALLILLILLVLYGYYRIKKYNISLNNKLSKTKDLILKDFETLQKDIDKEAIVSSKLTENEKLNENEKTTLFNFKEDIKNSEKEILQNIKDIEN